MRYFFSYIYHFLASNSRHGTHSPFVYALAEQVIYNASYKSKHFVQYPEGFNPRYRTVLNNILSFWEISALDKDLSNPDVAAFWLQGGAFDHEALLDLVEQGKVLVIHEPYAKAQRALWQSLIADERVTVSINLFHFGLILHRAGQRKEDFLLRWLG